MKNRRIARAAAVVIATAILCGIVPMIGVALRNSAIATTRETNILQTLATLPEGLRDCSTVLAYLFSTVGCIAIVAALAAVDLRITGSRRVVIRDVVVSAAPILYVTGVKWLVERPRPVTSAGSGLLPGDPSFPSGHTAAAVIVSVMMILSNRRDHFRHHLPAHLLRRLVRVERMRKRGGVVKIARCQRNYRRYIGVA